MSVFILGLSYNSPLMFSAAVFLSFALSLAIIVSSLK